ncbi:Uncharacterized conserved protein [Phaffia rhodozyma]|uniref:Uncharacterized conserved protein n=1 Tax=Phaffia rhodozyma TaxID=264483 RepID=A0A0F7SVS4_PHARH|nr:Uncharacterized conserved protein [Phaffia rhodozyma]
MKTPRFTLSQTDELLIANVHCPDISPEEIEIHTTENDVSLYIEPFFLRLHLPGPVLEDDSASAEYDSSSGMLTVQLSKVNKGETFLGLENIEALLGVGEKGEISQDTANKGKAKEAKIVEVEMPNLEGLSVEESERLIELKKEREIFLAAEANSWRLPQSIPKETPTTGNIIPAPAPLPVYPYGFNDRYSGLFKHGSSLPEELDGLGKDVENVSAEERFSRSMKAEDEKFDASQYQGDFVYNDEIRYIIDWRAPLMDESDPRFLTDETYFSAEEKELILSLPKTDYSSLPSSPLLPTVLLFLLSASYETRTTQSDPSPESPWTLTSLLPFFTSLVSFGSIQTVHQALRVGTRRMVAWPLYRHWELAERVRADVQVVLSGGRRRVLRVLLGMKKILDDSADFNVFSKIWLDDLCTFINQTQLDQTWIELGRELESTKFSKYDVGWDLEALEAETMEE